MAVELVVSRSIDDKNFQIDAKRTRTGTHYYKVPKEKADEFCASYKKFNKKRNANSDLVFFGSVFLGAALASLLTRKLGDVPKTIAMIASGLGAGYVTDSIMRKFFDKKSDNMLAQLGAQEIDIKSTPKVADIIK